MGPARWDSSPLLGRQRCWMQSHTLTSCTIGQCELVEFRIQAAGHLLICVNRVIYCWNSALEWWRYFSTKSMCLDSLIIGWALKEVATVFTFFIQITVQIFLWKKTPVKVNIFTQVKVETTDFEMYSLYKMYVSFNCCSESAPLLVFAGSHSSISLLVRLVKDTTLTKDSFSKVKSPSLVCFVLLLLYVLLSHPVRLRLVFMLKTHTVQNKNNP